MIIYVAEFLLFFFCFFVCKKHQFCKKFLQKIKSKKYGSHSAKTNRATCNYLDHDWQVNFSVKMRVDTLFPGGFQSEILQ